MCPRFTATPIIDGIWINFRHVYVTFFSVDKRLLIYNYLAYNTQFYILYKKDESKIIFFYIINLLYSFLLQDIIRVCH